MKRYHTLALAALLSVGSAAGSWAATTQKSAKAGSKMTAKAPTQYECTHCNIKMSAKEAKAHGMKCNCGMKLTAVKRPAKTMTKTKKS